MYGGAKTDNTKGEVLVAGALRLLLSYPGVRTLTEA